MCGMVSAKTRPLSVWHLLQQVTFTNLHIRWVLISFVYRLISLIFGWWFILPYTGEHYTWKHVKYPILGLMGLCGEFWAKLDLKLGCYFIHWCTYTFQCSLMAFLRSATTPRNGISEYRVEFVCASEAEYSTCVYKSAIWVQIVLNEYLLLP